MFKNVLVPDGWLGNSSTQAIHSAVDFAKAIRSAPSIYALRAPAFTLSLTGN